VGAAGGGWEVGGWCAAGEAAQAQGRLMLLSADRFWGELTLGDTIAFGVIIGGLVLWAVVVLVQGVIDVRRHGR
jgi:hypothetical protein